MEVARKLDWKIGFSVSRIFKYFIPNRKKISDNMPPRATRMLILRKDLFLLQKKKLLQAIKFESNRVTELSENCQTPSRLSKIHRVNEEDARSTKFHRIVASNNSTIAPRDKTSRRKGHKAAESRNDLYLRYEADGSTPRKGHTEKERER